MRSVATRLCLVPVEDVRKIPAAQQLAQSDVDQVAHRDANAMLLAKVSDHVRRLFGEVTVDVGVHAAPAFVIRLSRHPRRFGAIVPQSQRRALLHYSANVLIIPISFGIGQERRPKMGRKGVERATVGYVRVSTEEQATEGVSLDAQEARIAAYGAAMGWAVSEIVRDAGCSAKSLQRPGIAELLDRMRRREIERIIVVKLDRLTRSVVDLAKLLEIAEKRDVAIVSLSERIDTGSAMGRLMLNFMSCVSQWEREAIGERTAAALAHKRSQRQAYCGFVPFGFRREGDRLMEDTVEQAALADMRRMRSEGATLRAIAAMLHERNVRPHHGKAWHPSSIAAILGSKMTAETSEVA